ncbi:hypothetical protein NPIL_242721 [Nephila pilipes]|uniref:Uncharacterized protein n=1 Tax=Nephila pilipes TaxID=299642 RepID=A0A8X6QSJ6_NEPPI|nr:hypothetical protein NPIL_242721 [Nephila pilipes]
MLVVLGGLRPSQTSAAFDLLFGVDFAKLFTTAVVVALEGHPKIVYFGSLVKGELRVRIMNLDWIVCAFGKFRSSLDCS